MVVEDFRDITLNCIVSTLRKPVQKDQKANVAGFEINVAGFVHDVESAIERQIMKICMFFLRDHAYSEVRHPLKSQKCSSCTH